MAKGQFDRPQNDHIESFFPEFAKELDRGVDGAALTKWKQAKASSIMESPAFNNLDLKKNPRKAWFEMIVRKFTNYRNQVYRKSATATPTPALANRKANPLLKFSSITSGRQQFAKENSESITAAAHQRLLDTDNKSLAAVYQNVLKERWDSLSGEEQLDWNERAEKEAGDTSQNQREFVETMSLALRDLCQGGLIGDAEMVLWYSFREVGNGDLMAGSHSVHNDTNFGVGLDFHAEYQNAWWDFCDHSIPSHVVPNPLVPRNAAGQPVFPSIDVNTVKIAEVRTLLSDYFDQCWAHRAVGGQATSIPWDKIVSDPAAYYDTEAFRMKLDHPQNLSAVQLEPPSLPPSILKHNNSAPLQSSTIQPPKSESGPTGPLDTGHERKIVHPELSERPSPVVGSSPISQRDGSNTPPPIQPLRSPSPLPTPPSRQTGVKRKAKKGPEGTEERRKQDAKKPKLRLVDQVKHRCKVEEKVPYIPRVWHKSELILFAVDLGGIWLIQTAMKLWRNDHRRDLFSRSLWFAFALDPLSNVPIQSNSVLFIIVSFIIRLTLSVQLLLSISAFSFELLSTTLR
ncbi:hypothetical protein B0H14DRAFT_3171430 [Mycena olivaceomarginata]|nr:hypothetical protein B0H14DRAFT_3171430 [Mycena olivaceomarginata]